MVEVVRSYKTISTPVTITKIVAAIPCYNTQRTIAGVISRTKRYVDEVIVVDDGSTDGTALVAEFAGAKVVRHPTNQGYGEAVKSCFKAAQTENADILVIIDGDGQHNPDEIPRLTAPIRYSGIELAIGSRFIANGHKVPRYRRFGIGIITSLWNFGSRIKVSDTQSGFRAYDKKLIQGIKFTEKGMSASIEILEKARRWGIKVKEVPISCSYEDNNSSLSVKALHHGLDVAFSVLRIRLRNRLIKDEAY